VHILSGMTPEAQQLHAAFVAALPGYVTALFVERGYPLDRSAVDSIERATATLDQELGSELDRSFREQRRSPLEIVRRALAIPSAALAEAGVAPAATGGPLSDIDPYDLAPGSSSALGPHAHEAHLRWGVAKAAAFTNREENAPAKPAVLVMADARADRELLVSAIEECGMDPHVARNPGSVATAIERGPVVFALVDLAHRSARDAIARLVESSVSTIAYGDAVDDLMETGLRAQGVRDVVDRQRLLADPSAFLPLIA
jgi:hypothetical protein